MPITYYSQKEKEYDIEKNKSFMTAIRKKMLENSKNELRKKIEEKLKKYLEKNKGFEKNLGERFKKNDSINAEEIEDKFKKLIWEDFEYGFIDLKELISFEMKWNEEEKRVILESIKKYTNESDEFKIAEKIPIVLKFLPSDMSFKNKKEDFLKSFRKNPFCIRYIPSDIDLTDEKEEILHIAESDLMILEYLPKNIDWNDEKEKIFEIAKRNKYSVFKLPSSVDWNDKAEEFLNMVEEDYYYMLLRTDIDWNPFREKILRLAEKSPTIFEIMPSDIDWNPYKKDVLKLCTDEFAESFINWNDLSDLALLHSTRPDLYNDIFEKNDPIYNMDLDISLYFDNAPWLKRVVKKENDNIDSKKILLDLIFEKLENIGAIDYYIQAENRDIEDFGYTPKYLEKEEIKNYNINDKVEITALLLFYLNKLTKVNEAVMYSKALGTFFYDEDFEKKLKSNNDENSKTVELEKYEREKRSVEEKGDVIINTLEDLRREYVILSKKNEIVRPFSDFLEMWKSRKNKDGEINYSESSDLKGFYLYFNSKINELKEKGWKIEEIESIFSFSNKAIELRKELYNLKDVLVEHMYIYSQQEEYKDRIILQCEFDEPNDKDEHNDIMYVLLKGYYLPFTFHFDSKKHEDIKNNAQKVTDEFKGIYNKKDGFNQISLKIPFKIEDTYQCNINITNKEYIALEKLSNFIQQKNYKRKYSNNHEYDEEIFNELQIELESFLKTFYSKNIEEKGIRKAIKDNIVNLCDMISKRKNKEKHCSKFNKCIEYLKKLPNDIKYSPDVISYLNISFEQKLVLNKKNLKETNQLREKDNSGDEKQPSFFEDMTKEELAKYVQDNFSADEIEKMLDEKRNNNDKEENQHPKVTSEQQATAEQTRELTKNVTSEKIFTIGNYIKQKFVEIFKRREKGD